MADLFGFRFTRIKDDKNKEKFTLPSEQDGTIDVVFVGGINAPTGTPNQQNFISARSLTRAQFNTFDHLCRAMYITYPGMTIIGHSEYDTSQIDPGFNVTDYVQARFDR